MCEVDCVRWQISVPADSLCVPGGDNHKNMCQWLLSMWAVAFRVAVVKQDGHTHMAASSGLRGPR